MSAQIRWLLVYVASVYSAGIAIDFTLKLVDISYTGTVYSRQ